MTLKPFNLQQAKDGWAVYTRRGDLVRDWYHFPNAKGFSIAAVVQGQMLSFGADGSYLLTDGENALDLMLSHNCIYWVNVYSGETGNTELHFERLWPTQEIAKANACMDGTCIGAFPVEIS